MRALSNFPVACTAGAAAPRKNAGRPARRRALLPAVALALIGLGAVLQAATPATWRVQAWHVDDGLPDNRVVGLSQNPDGYLCVATREGLVRFNGAGFESLTLANPRGAAGSGIRALFADAQGNLWLDMYRETIVQVGKDSVRVFTDKEGVPLGELTSLAEDAAGHLWLEIGGTTCEVAGDRLRPLTLPPAVIVSDDRGRVWCALAHQLGVLGPAGFEPRFTLGEGPVVLARAQAGGLWICVGAQLLRLRDDGAPELRQSLAPGIKPKCLLEDRAGAVWIGTVANGLMRYDGTSVERVETTHAGISCLLEDQEGNIWAGTTGGGLNRLRPRVIDMIGPVSGQLLESLASVCEDADGLLWVVTANGQLARGNGRAWDFEQWPGTRVACVAADQLGNLWVGTRGQGLYRENLRTGVRQQWLKTDGLPSDAVRGLYVATDGAAWVATAEPPGICQVRAEKVQTIIVPPSVRTVRTITQDAHGDIWVGTSDGQVMKVIGDELAAEQTLADKSHSSVRSLLATADGSLWIGYAGRGVGWFKDGRLTMLSTRNGLLDNSLWHIVTDRSGAIWMAGPHGLSRSTMHDLLGMTEGKKTMLHPTLFGLDEGLAGFVANYNSAPAVCRTRDGRILFATSQGLLVVDPENLRDNPRPPPVILERVLVDDRVVALSKHWFPSRSDLAEAPLDTQDASAHLRLSSAHRKLTFDFAALSYSAPENVRFRYRLEGVDDSWTETGTEHTALYPRLSAGNYTFRVVACNDSGIWNDRGAAFAITVSPFFWQTWWFRIGLLSVFTGAVVLVVRLISFRRLRRKLQLAEQQAALSQERARIARDIHDDLGGSLSHIKLLGELALREPAAPGTANDSLATITTIAVQMLKSLDEIVWAINSRNDSLSNLISYLGQHALEFLRSAGIRCEVSLPENPPELEVTSAVRHHIFLAVKEALTNVVRHAQAGAVRLEIAVGPDLLQIGITDDGRGFESQPANAESDGLRNMRKRMAAVGGEMQVASRSGQGTRLVFKVALPRPVLNE
ncbi:MAG: two-component regulator propeller domain-containing protein [Lacunisphaera sp.]|nr:two-component regulator propeller domain-containing protein [Lacunisphaera sp.]